jgi:hypothetical protein
VTEIKVVEVGIIIEGCVALQRVGAAGVRRYGVRVAVAFGWAV